MKPIKINNYIEKCGKCGELVTRTFGTHDNWDIEFLDYCPYCGEKVDRNYEEETEDDEPKIFKVCPLCGRAAFWTPKLKRYICMNCNWEGEWNEE